MPGPRALLVALPPLCNCPEPPCCPGPLARSRSLTFESPFSRQHLRLRRLWILLQRVGDGECGDWRALGQALAWMGALKCSPSRVQMRLKLGSAVVSYAALVGRLAYRTAG